MHGPFGLCVRKGFSSQFVILNNIITNITNISWALDHWCPARWLQPKWPLPNILWSITGVTLDSLIVFFSSSVDMQGWMNVISRQIGECTKTKLLKKGSRRIRESQVTILRATTLSNTLLRTFHHSLMLQACVWLSLQKSSVRAGFFQTYRIFQK